MRGIIFERDGIGDADTLEGQPRLALEIGMIFRPPDAQGMRAAVEEIGIEERCYIPG